MVTLLYEFDLPYVFKFERILVGNYAVPRVISYIVDERLFPSRTSHPSNCGISTSTTSRVNGMSSVDPGIGKITFTIIPDLTNVSPNLMSRFLSIIGIDLSPE